MSRWPLRPLPSALRWQARPRARSVVLMYHAVGQVEVDPWGLHVSPSNFAAHLEVLNRRCRPVALHQLVGSGAGSGQRGRRGRSRVAVTFDDGYANNLHLAHPVLAHHDVPATVFAVSGQLTGTAEHWWDELAHAILRPVDLPPRLDLRGPGPALVYELGPAARYSARSHRAVCRYRDGDRDPDPRMTLYLRLWEHLSTLDDEARRRRLRALRQWADAPATARSTHRTLSPPELVTLASDGLVDIGSHTVTHPLLPALDHPALRRELVSSRTELEAILGRPVTAFSYPFGGHDDTVVEAVRSAGYTVAVTGRPRTSGPATDPLRIGRFDVKDWDGDAFERRLRRWVRYR